MKIILLQDVPSVGRKYEIKDVANGLARNFLIPNKQAEIATKSALRRAETFKKHSEAAREEEAAFFNTLIQKTEGETIAMKATANEQGNLFAAITAREIAQAMQEKYGFAVPESWIHLEDPIKKVGEYAVDLRHGDARASAKISVTAV